MEDREINLYINQVNEFVQVTLKFKDTITSSHLAQIRKLGKQIGIKLGVQELDAKFINSKDFVAVIKSRLYGLLNTIVMRKTPLKKPAEKAQHYKFWVEPSGNNHVLLKQVLKRRSWLNHVDIANESLD